MIRIKNLHDAARRMLKSKNYNYPDYERDDARNDSKMKRLFSDTLTGKIKGFYLVSDETFKAYHKSPKKAGFIQLSYGFYRNGELIPCGDIQIETFKDLTREGYTSGYYEIIA